jgi:DNA-directed RNA polymerase
MNEALKRGEVYTSRLGMRTLAWDWVQAMKPVLENHIENIRPKYQNSEGLEIFPSVEKDTENAKMDHIWLSALPVETLCAITIMEVIRSQANEARSMGSKAGNLISKVGKAVEKEIKASDLVKKENKGLHPRHINLRQLFAKRTRAEQYAARFHQELLKGTKGGVTHWPYEWRLDVRARVITPKRRGLILVFCHPCVEFPGKCHG